jgi:hypothetical protein
MRLDELNLTVLNLENENSELKTMLEMAQYNKPKNRMSISMSRSAFKEPANLYLFLIFVLLQLIQFYFIVYA